MQLELQRTVAPVRLPGMYPPQEDTALLIDAMVGGGRATGRRVLDVCTGTGALAMAAAAAGARSVTAVDLSWRAVTNARINSALRGAGIEVLRGDLFAPVAGRRFDLVVSNPPYVPAPSEDLPRHRMGRCWDGGVDGRVLVDRICDEVASVLAPGGTFLLVHSALTGADHTVRRLRAAGLEGRVAARATIPFGPVMTERAELFAERGLIRPAQRSEELVVIEATAAAEQDLTAVVRPTEVPDLMAG